MRLRVSGKLRVRLFCGWRSRKFQAEFLSCESCQMNLQKLGRTKTSMDLQVFTTRVISFQSPSNLGNNCVAETRARVDHVWWHCRTKMMCGGKGLSGVWGLL